VIHAVPITLRWLVLIRPRPVAALLLAGLLLAGPAHAQSPDPGVELLPHGVFFDGVGFLFSDELGASVNVTTLLGDAQDSGPFAPEPPSLRFSLYGPARTPRTGGQTGEVQVMLVADLEAMDYEARLLGELRSLLADRPPLGQGEAGSPGSIPLLVDENAAQGVRARAVYVDTEALSGVLFVTAFIQNTYPFSDDSFRAVFEGLSNDGTLAVHASFPLVASGFPRTISSELADRVQTEDGWRRYAQQVARRLDRASDGSFAPSLTAIDGLVRSIRIQGVSAPGPSPSASPAG
jgi:hypothetical protein